MELTIEQRRAIALARARRRRAETQGGNPPPLGMTAQQAAEQAMGAAVEQNQSPEAVYGRMSGGDKIAAGVTSALKGVPFVGEGLDELIGFIDEDAANTARRQTAAFEASNPTLATAAQIGTGVASAIPMAGAALPALAARAPASMAGRVLYGAGAGAATGAAEGTASGYLAGQGDTRGDTAAQRGAMGAGFGGVVGAAAPLVATGVANVVRNVRGRPDRTAARALGGSPESAEVVGRMLTNDDPAQAVGRIASGGERAMVADAGPATSGLLDTAIQRAGPGGRVARDAIEQRAIGSARDINEALDIALGRVPPIDPAAARSANRRASQVRSALYDRAYSKPIDYSGPNGRRIEELLPRVPQDAINAANKLMQVEGQASRQILFDIADDRTITLRQMPDVRQLDYITRGLNQTAEAGADAGALGGRTPVSRAYQQLSREIRNELKDAVPEYRTALERAATDIGVKQAQEIGEVALRPGMSRGDLAETLMDMGAREKAVLRRGVRTHVDDLLARVRRTAGSNNTEAREGLKALTELSSRENRDKLRMILGDDAARTLTDKIDQAGRSFELRARTADGSQTFARQNMNEVVAELTQPGMVGELLSGSPVAATRKLVQSMTNMTPQARRAVEERISGEIATMLTQRTGADAQAAVQQLVRMLERAPVTERLAQQIGRQTATAVGAGGYRSMTQLTNR